MNILITGGSGFIGSRLVPFLKRAGNDVTLFDGDISDKKNFVRFENHKIDALIHLAAKINSRNEKEFKQVNVEGTRNVAEFCRRTGVGRLIFLSSIRVLSSTKNPYNDSKREAEKIITDLSVPCVIIRPSQVYGAETNETLDFY